MPSATRYDPQAGWISYQTASPEYDLEVRVAWGAVSYLGAYIFFNDPNWRSRDVDVRLIRENCERELGTLVG